MTPIEDVPDVEDLGAGDAFHAGPEVNVGGFEGGETNKGISFVSLAPLGERMGDALRGLVDLLADQIADG